MPSTGPSARSPSVGSQPRKPAPSLRISRASSRGAKGPAISGRVAGSNQRRIAPVRGSSSTRPWVETGLVIWKPSRSTLPARLLLALGLGLLGACLRRLLRARFLRGRLLQRSDPTHGSARIISRQHADRVGVDAVGEVLGGVAERRGDDLE